MYKRSSCQMHSLLGLKLRHQIELLQFPSHFSDIDECADKNGGCSHECVNTDGGFFCICPPGHLLAANNTCVGTNARKYHLLLP